MHQLEPQVADVRRKGATTYGPTPRRWACISVALVFAAAADSGPRPQGPVDGSPPNSQIRAGGNGSVLQREVTEAKQDSTTGEPDVTDESEEDCE